MIMVMEANSNDGPKVLRIHAGKQPRRPHYLAEWAHKHGFMSQADLAEALGADKSIVSRWYHGASPSVDYQIRLAALFGIEDEPESIFRDPDDDWLARFFKGRSAEERDRIKRTLEAAFPLQARQNQK